MKQQFMLRSFMINLFGNTHPKFHHIGLAVSDETYTKCFDVTEYDDPIQNVKVSFIDLYGCPIEFIKSDNEKSPIYNNLKKGIKLLHLCFEVNDIDEAIRKALENNFIIIKKPEPATAFNYRCIAWIYHKLWGLIELLER